MTTTPAAAPAPAAKAAPKAAPAPAREDVYTALAAVSSAIPALTKDGLNSYLKTKYLTLGALLAAVRDPLLECGCVIVSQLLPVGAVPGMWCVETTVRHMASETEVSSSFPIPDLSTQKAGAAATFGMRYNLMHLLARAADDDDDGAQLAGPPPQGFDGQVPQGQQRSAPAQMPQNPQVGAAWL